VAWCKTRNLAVIEDAACALGSTYDKISPGEISDVACYSFHARKIITTGEGGAAVTNRPELYKKIRAVVAFGVETYEKSQLGPTRHEFRQLGYNFKLSDINCSIGLQQIRHLPALLERRAEVAAQYRRAINALPGLTPPVVDPKALHTYQAFVCRAANEALRDRMIDKLRQRDVHSTIGTYAQHLQPVFASADRCPNSQRLYETTIALPFHPFLGQPQVDHIVEQLKVALTSEF
jgi:dTDP-4-amino-4,6-dideoxygalactose transaminase